MRCRPPTSWFCPIYMLNPDELNRIFHGLLVRKRWEWPFYEPFRSYFFVGIRSHSGVTGRASTNLTTVAVAARSPPSFLMPRPLPRSSPSTSSSLWPRPGVGVTWRPTLDQSAGEGGQPHPHGGFLSLILMNSSLKFLWKFKTVA